MSKPFMKKGNSPKNARIKINYEGKKPTVRFSYPCKKHQFESSMFFPIFSGWMIFVFLTLAVHGAIVSINEKQIELNQNCTLAIDNYIKNNLTDIKEAVCNNVLNKVTSSLWESFMQSFYSLREGTTWFWIFIFLVYFFAPPCLIYFPFKKSWSNVFPAYQALWTKKKIKVFVPKEVLYDKDLGYYCEVILFHNIVFNFEATKEFSKYLKEFEIREHNFRFIQRRKKAKKHKGKYVPPKTFNEWYWYARFYFKEKPRTGTLEVVFK